jgi:hypothetical protein
MIGAIVDGDVRRLVAGPHTQTRMVERGITISMIQAVVTSPDVTFSRADGCTEYVGRWQARRLKVVIDERRVPAFIRTVHWIEEQEP